MYAAYMSVFMSVCMYAYMFICSACMYVCICVYMYVCMYVCMYLLVQRVRLTFVSCVAHGIAGWNRLAVAIVRRWHSSTMNLYVCMYCVSMYVCMCMYM